MADRSTEHHAVKGSRKAAWTLIVLAPLCAELTFSGVTMPVMWLLLPILLPMYGAGVLLVRELVARARGGWPSLLLMGVVYELAEDGLGLQALTSPNLYNAADWGPRVLGFNTTYWESQIGYHAVFSVLIPVLLTDLLFPRHRGRPYLKRGGLVTVSIAAVIGVALLRVTFAATEDPGYQVPLPIVAGIVLAIVALSFVALRVLPGRAPKPVAAAIAPHPAVGALVAAAAAGTFLGLLIPAGLPPDGPAFGQGAWVFVPMTLAATIAVGAGLLIRRWCATDTLTATYPVWLVGGALIGRTLFVVGTAPAANDYNLVPTAIAIAIGTALIFIMPLLLIRLGRHVTAEPDLLVSSPMNKRESSSRSG